MGNLPVNIVEVLFRASPWSLSLRVTPSSHTYICLSLSRTPCGLRGKGGLVSGLSPALFSCLLLWASCSLYLFLKL